MLSTLFYTSLIGLFYTERLEHKLGSCNYPSRTYCWLISGSFWKPLWNGRVGNGMVEKCLRNVRYKDLSFFERIRSRILSSQLMDHCLCRQIVRQDGYYLLRVNVVKHLTKQLDNVGRTILLYLWVKLKFSQTPRTHCRMLHHYILCCFLSSIDIKEAYTSLYK